MLVDDNPLNLQLLRTTLDGRGYRLLAALSGEQALQIAEKARPELILLDVMMPGLDGYETCNRLLANEATRNSAVIFLSALNESKDKVHALSLGAVDFITKPFDSDEVIARVARQLEIQQKQQQLAEQNRTLATRLDQLSQLAPENADQRRQWIESLIKQGESERLEFKSTLRWNLRADKSDKAIESAWLKSIVAFINSDGGVLMVGVDDSGTILGLDADRFENDDKLLLFVNNRIKQHIGLECAPFIHFNLTPFGEKQVLTIECRASESPLFLTIGEAESFYIRIGPGSRKLSVSEVLNYMANRSA